MPEDGKMEKPTVGEEAYKRLLNPDDKQGIVDTQREIDKEYFKEIEECVRKVKGKDGYEKEFFVVVIAKKERLMENVIRRYFVARKTLPTPEFDQTVWRYRTGGDLDFIWCTPDHNTCQEMYNHPERVPPEEKWLHSMVCALMEGRLYHEACKSFGIPVEVDSEAPPKLVLSSRQQHANNVDKHI